MFRKLFLLYLHDIQNAVLCKPGCKGLAIPVQGGKTFEGSKMISNLIILAFCFILSFSEQK